MLTHKKYATPSYTNLTPASAIATNTHLRNTSAGSNLTTRDPHHEPTTAITAITGTTIHKSAGRNPLPTYTGILVTSTASETTAAVAIYADFSRPNALKNAERNAPPVPIKPAKKPDKLPPTTLFCTDSRIRTPFHPMPAYPTRKTPRTRTNSSCGA